MIGEMVDSFVSVFSPARAAQRAHARQIFRKISQRAYEAARVDRTTSAWTTNSTSADRALYGEAERVRNRVRDLVRNDCYARGALDAIVHNVVGCGIVPKPALEDFDRSAQILDKWNVWCESADVTTRLHFYEMQALTLRECIETGETLLNKVLLPTGALGEVPLALELIESERIATETDVFYGRQDKATGNQIRRGVEVDSAGKPVAYWLYPVNPNDLGYGYGQAERIDADRVLHLYRQERIGQTRGVSWLAPLVLRCRDLGMYMENELQASAVAACFSVAIKTVDSGASWAGLNTPDGEESTDGNSDRLERLQPGGVSHLFPNEDISVIDPSRPNSNADPWITLMLRSMAVGCGISYELISRDFSKTTYSSSRASSLEDQRRFQTLQKWLIWKLCQPVYRLWFRQAVLAKESGAPGFDMFPTLSEYIEAPEVWTKCNWRAPGWAWVDPLKEVQAAELEVKNGFRSRGDIIEAAGGDLRETFTELAEEQELADELGLTLGEPQEKVNEPQEGQPAAA